MGDHETEAQLDAIVDAVDNLPEPVRQFYRAGDDGKFRLAVRPVGGWGLEDVGGLKSTLGKLKTESAQLKALREKWGDLDPDSARSALEQIENLRDAVPEEKMKAALASLEGQLKKKHESELAEARKQAETFKSLVDTHVVDSEALAAIAEHEGIPRLLLPIVRGSLRPEIEDGKVVVRVVDESGNPMISQQQGSQGYMTVSEFVAGLKKDKDLMAAFKGRDATGSGAGNANANRGGGSRIPDNVVGERRLAMIHERGERRV